MRLACPVQYFDAKSAGSVSKDNYWGEFLITPYSQPFLLKPRNGGERIVHAKIDCGDCGENGEYLRCGTIFAHDDHAFSCEIFHPDGPNI